MEGEDRGEVTGERAGVKPHGRGQQCSAESQLSRMATRSRDSARTQQGVSPPLISGSSHRGRVQACIPGQRAGVLGALCRPGLTHCCLGCPGSGGGEWEQSLALRRQGSSGSGNLGAPGMG